MEVLEANYAVVSQCSDVKLKSNNIQQSYSNWWKRKRNEKMKDGGGTKEDDITVKALFLKLEEYCPPKKNLIVKRRKFFTRNQQHETIDAYITKLRNVSSACEFGDAKEGLILYKLVDGIQSYRIRGTLLRKGADWILKRAIDLCRADETTNHEMKIIKLL